MLITFGLKEGARYFELGKRALSQVPHSEKISSVVSDIYKKLDTKSQEHLLAYLHKVVGGVGGRNFNVGSQRKNANKPYFASITSCLNL